MFLRLHGRKVLSGLAMALVLSLTGCGTEEPPKQIDTSAQPKAPGAANVESVKVKGP